MPVEDIPLKEVNETYLQNMREMAALKHENTNDLDSEQFAIYSIAISLFRIANALEEKPELNKNHFRNCIAGHKAAYTKLKNKKEK